MVDAALLEQQYDTNIPDTAREVSARIDALDAELMQGALEQRLDGKQRLGDMLKVMTACLSFFNHVYKRWEAILKNEVSAAYMTVKARVESSGEKFVSAAADRESDYAVREIRYVASYYEGEVSRAQEHVNTLKKLLDAIDAEEKST